MLTLLVSHIYPPELECSPAMESFRLPFPLIWLILQVQLFPVLIFLFMSFLATPNSAAGLLEGNFFGENEDNTQS